MTEAIIVALITGGISLIGTLATTRSSAKSTQALVDYKLKELSAGAARWPIMCGSRKPTAVRK